MSDKALHPDGPARGFQRFTLAACVQGPVGSAIEMSLDAYTPPAEQADGHARADARLAGSPRSEGSVVVGGVGTDHCPPAVFFREPRSKARSPWPHDAQMTDPHPGHRWPLLLRRVPAWSREYGRFRRPRLPATAVGAPISGGGVGQGPASRSQAGLLVRLFIPVRLFLGIRARGLASTPEQGPFSTGSRGRRSRVPAARHRSRPGIPPYLRPRLIRPHG